MVYEKRPQRIVKVREARTVIDPTVS